MSGKEDNREGEDTDTAFLHESWSEKSDNLDRR